MSILIKGGRIVTASDDYVADVFIEGETVTLIGESLDVDADRVIDARGQVRPAGLHRPAHAPRHAVRRHGHDRRLPVGPDVVRLRRHDLPRRLRIQASGQTFADALAAWHAKANGKAADRQRLPHRRHRPRRGRHARGARDAARPGRHLVQALHGLQGRRCRSTTRRSSGRWSSRRRRGALVMVHAENGDVDRRARQARRSREGNLEPRWHALTRPAGDRGRGDEPRDPARARRRLPALRRPRLLQGVRRADRTRRARRAGPSGARRARSTSSSTTRTSSGRTSRARSTSTRRRARDKANQDVLWDAVRTDVLSAISTDHCAFLLGRPEDARQGRLLEDPERRPRHREPAADDPPLRRQRGPDHAQPDGRAARRRTRRSSSASTRARARSPPAPTPTS